MSDGDCGSHHGDLTAALKYRFQDSGLLAEALLHPSINPQDRGRAPHGYQRLEFLGDRVIGLLAAQWLLEKHPEESEGAIARRHAHLVRGGMLAIIAEDLDLGRFVALSPSEEAAGGRHNPAILADIMEALAGAVFLDGGIEPARNLLFPLFEKHIDHAEGPPRDPKTGLQEWAQARGLELPTYRVIGRDGPAHKPEFHVEASIAGWPPMAAKGDTKRQAEKRAAAALLTLVDADDR